MNLRIAIVGAGRMGRERARASKSLGAQIVAICDPDLDRARTLASDAGAKAIADADELDLSSLDALFVCTPPALRGSMESAAIRAGVPIMVEKPIGLSAEQCLPIMEALRVRPVINAVGYMNRYRQSVLAARQQIQSATTIGVAFQWFATRYRVPWWLDCGVSGGPINEQCTHFIDMCRFLVGEIAEVQAMGRPMADVPNAAGTAAIALRFQNGLLGTGLYSCESSEKQIAFDVFLPDRSIRLQGWDLRFGAESSPEDIFIKEVAAFFQAIQSGDPSLILSDLESGIRTQMVIDAIQRAVKSGTRVGTLPEVPLLR
jgi:myo-inositol 2-dehydrogenase/D-chiro-inositol 1-dehydrogenase